MKVRCTSWKTCQVYKCPEWPAHEERKGCKNELFCQAAEETVKCVPISKFKRGKDVPTMTKARR